MPESRHELDAAVALVLVLDRLLRVSKQELAASELDRDLAREATERVSRWRDQIVASEAAKARGDAALHSDVSRFLDDAIAALDSGDPAAALERAVDLAGRLDVVMPSDDIGAWIGDGKPDDEPWTLGQTRKRKSPSIPAKANARLPGHSVDPPGGTRASVLLQALTQDADRLWERPLAGTQLAIRRSLGHSHHGLYLGDGSVVHFAGEPGSLDWRKASIKRVPLSEFLEPNSMANVSKVEVTRGEGAKVATLRSGIACLRAASCEGTRGGEYNLLSNNCEHFASWSMLGVPVSGQVKDGTQIGAGFASSGVHLAESLLDDLGYALQVRQSPLSEPLLEATTLGDFPVDVGRARWDEDLDQLVFWVPVWGDGEPLGGPDLAWSAGDVDDLHHATCPAVSLAGDWHAALLAYPDGSTCWLDTEGNWRAAEVDVLELVEMRIAPSVAIAREVLAGPSSRARSLVELIGGLAGDESDNPV